MMVRFGAVFLTVGGLFCAVSFVTTSSISAAISTTTVSFQDGVDGYSGTLDRRINVNGNDASGSAVDTDASSFFLDGALTAVDRADLLLRFDSVIGGSGVPTGVKVIEATLDLRTTSPATSANSQSTGAYNVYRLDTPFDSGSTWAGFSGNGLGTQGDSSLIAGSFANIDADSVGSARVEKIVQTWVDGATNNGFGIRADNTGDGWSINTTGAATATNHPKLNVTYTTDSDVRIQSYQQGIDGYSGTVDVFPNGNSGASAGTVIDGATVDQGFLDGSNGTDSPDAPYFVRFDNIDLNYNSIYKAELIMKTGFSSTSADTPGTFSVHQSLIDFDTATTYTSLDSNGDPSLNDAAELVAGGTVAGAAASPTNIEDGEVVNIDVTSIVENWRLGAANQGFYIGSANTDNGWQIFASGALDPEFAPELRIIGVVPEPGAFALLLGAAICGVRCRRNRIDAA